ARTDTKPRWNRNRPSSPRPSADRAAAHRLAFSVFDDRDLGPSPRLPSFFIEPSFSVSPLVPASPVARSRRPPRDTVGVGPQLLHLRHERALAQDHLVDLGDP